MCSVLRSCLFSTHESAAVSSAFCNVSSHTNSTFYIPMAIFSIMICWHPKHVFTLLLYNARHQCMQPAMDFCIVVISP